MAFGFGSNGQWVRARNAEGAKAFLAEKRVEAEKLEERREHELQVIGRLWGRVRRLFHRSR